MLNDGNTRGDFWRHASQADDVDHASVLKNVHVVPPHRAAPSSDSADSCHSRQETARNRSAARRRSGVKKRCQQVVATVRDGLARPVLVAAANPRNRRARFAIRLQITRAIPHRSDDELSQWPKDRLSDSAAIVQQPITAICCIFRAEIRSFLDFEKFPQGWLTRSSPYAKCRNQFTTRQLRRLLSPDGEFPNIARPSTCSNCDRDRAARRHFAASRRLSLDKRDGSRQEAG